MLNCLRSNGTKVVVKNLFDSPFVERNKLLIYDDDPVKEAVMKNAKERFDEQLKMKVTMTKTEEQNI